MEQGTASTMPKGASEESAVAAKSADEAPARPIRVLVADDQALVCNGFASIINTQGDMHAVATASTGEEAVNLSARLKPDVILMDVRMPVMDGIEATRRICSLQYDNGSTPHVIILTTFDLDEYVMSAILAGASGFLLKPLFGFAPCITAMRSLRPRQQNACSHTWWRIPVRRCSNLPLCLPQQAARCRNQPLHKGPPRTRMPSSMTANSSRSPLGNGRSS